MTRLLPFLTLYLLALLAYAAAPAGMDWRWDVVIGTLGAFWGLIGVVKAVRG